ncbi:hypothetical protein ACH4PU_32125 [Streptomyces sp. NPDC021100]|uniref:hypothetical protein n=1 Tax=Streptomyces sp. NPDC021100 TaxID=3365114 RepID=UPI0037A0FB71
MTAKDLFQRYMRAFQDSTEHTGTCEPCQAGQPCQDGEPLHERFARLQDAYRARLSQQQRR